MSEAISAMNNWVVKGNPARNNFDQMLRRTKPDPWSTEKSIPSDMAAGDRVFLYESSPSKQLIALASVANPQSRQQGTHNYFTLLYKTQRFRKTLHQDELRVMPGLDNPSFLKSGNAATIYRIAPAEAGVLLQAIYERNPEIGAKLGIAEDNLEESLPFVDHDALFALPEGNPRLRRHLTYERRPELIIKKKNAVKSEKGSLECEVCNFNFSYSFGDRGRDFCEVHHRDPLSQNPPKVTALADLAIVCSNCHRMLHRQPWTTVEVLRQSIFHMLPTLQYKGQEGSVLYSPEDHLLHGRLLSIRDTFSYEGTSISTIETAFRETVEEYLAQSKEQGNARVLTGGTPVSAS